MADPSTVAASAARMADIHAGPPAALADGPASPLAADLPLLDRELLEINRTRKATGLLPGLDLDRLCDALAGRLGAALRREAEARALARHYEAELAIFLGRVPAGAGD